MSEEAKRSKEIDNYLEQEALRIKEEMKIPKVLLVGSSDSGKSTVIKQLKIIHSKGFTTQEVEHYTRNVYANIANICTLIINRTDKVSENMKYAQLMAYCEQDFKTESLAQLKVTNSIVTWIKDLLNDPAVKNSNLSRSSLGLQDTHEYFLNPSNLTRFAQASYSASNEDILNVRVPTTAVAEHKFNLNVPLLQAKELRIFDVTGIRPDRKHWIPYFSEVNVIWFVLSLASYDQMIEDSLTNKMSNAIEAFDKIINEPLLGTQDVVIFLNKSDLFAKKVLISPIDKHFSDFNQKVPEAQLAKEGYRFFKSKLEACVTKTREITFHPTSSIDTPSMTALLDKVLQSVVKKILAKVVPVE